MVEVWMGSDGGVLKMEVSRVDVEGGVCIANVSVRMVNVCGRYLHCSIEFMDMWIDGSLGISVQDGKQLL